MQNQWFALISHTQMHVKEILVWKNDDKENLISIWLIIIGGPLFIETDPNRYEIIGTVSFGDGCAREFPGIYGKLGTPSTLNWIQNYIQKSGASVCSDPARIASRAYHYYGGYNLNSPFTSYGPNYYFGWMLLNKKSWMLIKLFLHKFIQQKSCFDTHKLLLQRISDENSAQFTRRTWGKKAIMWSCVALHLTSFTKIISLTKTN